MEMFLKNLSPLHTNPLSIARILRDAFSFDPHFFELNMRSLGRMESQMFGVADSEKFFLNDKHSTGPTEIQALDYFTSGELDSENFLKKQGNMVLTCIANL